MTADPHPQTLPTGDCPKCGSDSVYWGHVEVDEQETLQEGTCRDCDSEWTDHYQWHRRVYLERSTVNDEQTPELTDREVLEAGLLGLAKGKEILANRIAELSAALPERDRTKMRIASDLGESSKLSRAWYTLNNLLKELDK